MCCNSWEFVVISVVCCIPGVTLIFVLWLVQSMYLHLISCHHVYVCKVISYISCSRQTCIGSNLLDNFLIVNLIAFINMIQRNQELCSVVNKKSVTILLKVYFSQWFLSNYSFNFLNLIIVLKHCRVGSLFKMLTIKFCGKH